MVRVNDNCRGNAPQVRTLGVGRGGVRITPFCNPSAQHAQREQEEQQIEEGRNNHCEDSTAFSSGYSNIMSNIMMQVHARTVHHTR